MVKIQFLLLLVMTLLFPSKIFANDAFLLPKDVSEAFQKLEQPEKSRHCGGVGRHALSELAALSASKPPTKIEGYNSRMDNMAKWREQNIQICFSFVCPKCLRQPFLRMN